MKEDIKSIITNNNHFPLLKITDYSKEEQKELIKFFAEGSITMELALRTLWNKKLYTTACCASHLFGEKDWMLTYKDAYFAFEKGLDVLKYLSDDLLSNPYVMFFNTDGYQSIYFFGKDKESLILKFINDILAFKEINSKYLKQKMNKSIDLHSYNIAKRDYYLESGFTEEEVQEIENIDIQYLLLDEENKYTYVSEEKYDNLFDKRLDVYIKLMSRKLGKKRGR